MVAIHFLAIAVDVAETITVVETTEALAILTKKTKVAAEVVAEVSLAA
jgi:hypothetical protein